MSDTLHTLGLALRGIGWGFLPALALPLMLLATPKSVWIRNICGDIIRTIDSVNYGLGEIIKWALPVLVLTVAFSVFALSIFGLSWTKLFESAAYLHASVIMLGAGATLLAGKHVRVDIFHASMTTKSRALVDFCGYYIFLLPVCLIILWNSQTFTSFAWRIFEGSAEADGIRGQYLLKTLVPLFTLIMITQGLAIAMRAAMLLTGHETPERPPHTPRLFKTSKPTVAEPPQTGAKTGAKT